MEQIGALNRSKPEMLGCPDRISGGNDETNRKPLMCHWGTW
jgi:hypothetical protein